MTQEASILLIEDEPEIRRFLRTSLPAHGLRLYESSTAKEGLIEAKARNPDLILLDLGLPDLDGSEVIHACGSGPRRRLSCCPRETRKR